jgi:hypothetical protein
MWSVIVPVERRKKAQGRRRESRRVRSVAHRLAAFRVKLGVLMDPLSIGQEYLTAAPIPVRGSTVQVKSALTLDRAAFAMENAQRKVMAIRRRAEKMAPTHPCTTIVTEASFATLRV